MAAPKTPRIRSTCLSSHHPVAVLALIRLACYFPVCCGLPAVDVKVGGAAQTSVSVKTPEKSTTTTAATKTTASKPQKPEKSITAAAGATAAA